MRQLLLGLAVSAALVGGAAAQPTTPHQSGFTSETTPLGFLPPVAMEWMLAEAVRQAQDPSTIEELDASIQTAVGPELDVTGRKTRMGKADMLSLMRFEIVREARDLIREEIKERKADQNSDQAMLALQSAEARRKTLDSRLKAARNKLTRKAAQAVSDQ